METIIDKETADRRPTLWQGVRSALPYLSGPSEPRHGQIVASSLAGLRFWVYLPDAAETTALPVLYHLHGAGMFWSWVRKDVLWLAREQEQAVAAGLGSPQVIIAPYDATKFSMWADHGDGRHHLERQVTRDLPRHVEATYNVLRGRENTHIQGFSMGGFGAATIGLKHQEQYGTITIFDGAMHDWETLRAGRPGIAKKQFLGDAQVFAKWSPWEWANRADLSRTPIFIAEGLMATYNRTYRDHLRSLGADVTYVITPCLHDLRGLLRTVGQRAFAFTANGGESAPDDRNISDKAG